MTVVTAFTASGHQVVVPEHASRRLQSQGNIRVLACPEQTSGVSCASCRLCMRDDFLRESGATIAFAAHGSPASKSKALRALSVATADAPLRAA